MYLEDALDLLGLEWTGDYGAADDYDLTELGGTSLAQAGSDVWVRALIELGLAKHDNTNGTIEIECPWVDGHTDAARVGTAYLGKGCFKCQHDHCSERHSGHFKDAITDRLAKDSGHSIFGWRVEMETSVAEQRLEEEYLLAKSAEHMFDPPPPGARQLSHAGLTFGSESEAVARLVYVSGEQVFLDEQTGAVLTKVEVDEALWPVASEKIKRGQNAVTNMMLIRSDLRRVHHRVYRPGLGRWVRDEHQGGVEAVNTWKAPDLAGSPAGQHLKVILNHIENRLFKGDPVDAGIWLDWSAALVQRPAEKCNWMPILIGAGGTGKDLLFGLYGRLIGPENLYVVGTSGMQDRATLAEAVKHKLILIEELLGTGTRTDMANMLKPLVTCPPMTITVRHNYRPPESVAKVANLVAYTNNVDALHVGTAEERRRYFIYQSKAVMLTPSEAAELALAVEKGAGEFLGFLLGRDLSKWNPYSKPITPATTRAGDEMMVAGMSGAAQQVVDLMSEGEMSSRNLVPSTELRSSLASLRLPANVINHAVREGMPASGFTVWAEGRQLRLDGGSPRVWVRSAVIGSGVHEWGTDKMRDAVEHERKASAEDRARGLFGDNVVALPRPSKT